MVAIGLGVGRAEAEFADWEGLLALILASFAGMHARIAPPSSALRLTPASLAERAAAEWLFLARDGEGLAGCVLAAPKAGWLYLGKLAVRPGAQGKGIGRALVAAADEAARAAGLAGLELETRVELTENHAAFARMGFVETGRNAHPGFDRPTSVTFRRAF